MSVSSQRSLRSASSCSALSEATTLVEAPQSPSLSPPPPYEPFERTRVVSTFGPSSWASTSSSSYTASPPASSPSSTMIMNPETPSQLVQLICRLLPNSRLSKKMKNTEKDGLKIIEKMEGKEGKEREKRDLKIQKLLEKDRMMDEEFKRLGF